jgi:hypothetical protein
MSKRELKITIEYPERTEYEVRINEEGFPEAGNIYDHFEADPKYLVREISRDEEGNIIYDECLEEFVMYEEAKQFVKEMENK